MSTSGTATFNLQIDDILTLGIERAFGEETSGYELRKGAIQLNLLLQEFQTRGNPMWCREVVAIKNPIMIADAGSYTLDASIVDVVGMWTRNITTTPVSDDLIVALIPQATYDLIPNKSDPGRSYQYMIDKQRDQFVIYLYPVVNVDSMYALYARCVRRLQDALGSANDYTVNLDIPARWLPTIIAGVGWYVARDRRKLLGAEWVEEKHEEFEACYAQAASNDTDAAPTRLEVDASAYFGN